MTKDGDLAGMDADAVYSRRRSAMWLWWVGGGRELWVYSTVSSGGDKVGEYAEWLECGRHLSATPPQASRHSTIHGSARSTLRDTGQAS